MLPCLQAKNSELEASAIAAKAQAARLRGERNTANTKVTTLEEQLQQTKGTLAEAHDKIEISDQKYYQDTAALHMKLSTAAELEKADKAAIAKHCREISALQVVLFCHS